MKTVSAHITGFFRSTFHAYTTEVDVDGHRWRLGLRYSKFHEFYEQLSAREPEFAAVFPPKGTLFFTPKPEERQEQLEAFMQEVLEFFAVKGRPAHMEELLVELLKIPKHLRDGDRDDSASATSEETMPEESIPMQERVEPVAEVDKVEKPQDDEEKPPMAAVEPKEEIEATEKPKEEIEATEEPKEELEATEEPKEEIEKTVKPVETVKEASAESEKVVGPAVPEEGREEPKEPLAKETVTSEASELASELASEAERLTTVAGDKRVEEKAVEQDTEQSKEEAAEEFHVATEPEAEAEVTQQHEQSAEEEKSEVCVSKQQETESEEKEPADTVLARLRFSTSWFATYLRSNSVLDFIRHRCMGKTSFVVLCVALVLPAVFSRR